MKKVVNKELPAIKKAAESSKKIELTKIVRLKVKPTESTAEHSANRNKKIKNFKKLYQTESKPRRNIKSSCELGDFSKLSRDDQQQNYFNTLNRRVILLRK